MKHPINTPAGAYQFSDEIIRKFETGAIRDTEDEKPDLVTTKAFLADWRYARYMTSKKSKYGVGNFHKGIPIDVYERSLMRHIYKYFMNKYEGGQEEPNEDHLCGARFNLDGIMFEEERARLNQSTLPK